MHTLADIDYLLQVRYELEFQRIRTAMPEVVGHQRYCPVCRSMFKEFGSFNGRPDARCPVCGSLERHRHLFLLLKERLLPGKVKLLHFAPEPFLRAMFSRNPLIDYYDCDIDAKAAHYVEDIQHLSLADETFDVIICAHVLEHVPDDALAMRELYRVLKKDGTLFITVPDIHGDPNSTLEDPAFDSAALRKRHYGQADHLRLYGRNDFTLRLLGAGFFVSVSSLPQNRDYDMFRLGDLFRICKR
jgi:SAM-dependent methyltransferase